MYVLFPECPFPLATAPGADGLEWTALIGQELLTGDCWVRPEADLPGESFLRYHYSIDSLDWSTFNMPLQASGKAVKKDGKIQKSVSAVERKKRKGGKEYNYSGYIYKVLKNILPDTSITHNAISYLNYLLNDIFARFAAEAFQLSCRKKRGIISSHEIKIAVQLLFPSELARCAISYGDNAVDKYTSSKDLS